MILILIGNFVKQNWTTCIPVFRVLRVFVLRMIAMFRNTYQSELFLSALRTVQ